MASLLASCRQHGSYALPTEHGGHLDVLLRNRTYRVALHFPTWVPIKSWAIGTADFACEQPLGLQTSRFANRTARGAILNFLPVGRSHRRAFSREGRETRNKLLNSFQFVLRCLNNEPKFVTIHSRQAESAVLELLKYEYPHPVVFHWYSGTLNTLESAIQAGHFFSINPAMVRSTKGRNTTACNHKSEF